MGRGTLISIGLVVSVVAAFGMFWQVGNYAKGRFEGSGFEPRFPEKTLSYDVDKFRRLTASDVRKAYVVPLLFPLDLIVMLALAGTMGAAIWYWLGTGKSCVGCASVGAFGLSLERSGRGLSSCLDAAAGQCVARGDDRDIEDAHDNQACQCYRVHGADGGRFPAMAVPRAIGKSGLVRPTPFQSDY